MSSVEPSLDDLYRACITWDVPAIRRSNNDDATGLLQTLQLYPGAFLEDKIDARKSRMSPLRRATYGLRAELSGDPDTARDLYILVSRQRGLRGLLGLLLLAWSSDAVERDFERVEVRLRSITGSGSRDLTARCHCKLAMWAGDHGWPDRAAHHFAQARASAGKELGAQLDEIGDLFGLDQFIRFRRKRGDMIRFPWVLSWADMAARKSIEEQLKRSIRSPWARTWTFGSSSIEGSDIQSAELQASWCGGLWLMPTIQREHAALILAQSREPEDVTRAIALWVRGDGPTPGRLIDSLEGYLTDESVDELLITHLHEGRSVMRSQRWVESCLALWSELPAQVIESLVHGFNPPDPSRGPHDETAKELTLFGFLLAQSELATAKAVTFSDAQLAMLLRAVPNGIVDRLHPSIVERALRSATFDRGTPWNGVGLHSLARGWWRLPNQARSELRESVAEMIPTHEIAEASMIAPGLFDDEALIRALDDVVEMVEQDARNASRGIFSGRSREPSTDLQWLASNLGRLPPTAGAALVRLANSLAAAPGQRQMALVALISLTRQGLLSEPDLGSATRELTGTVSTAMADDDDSDQRYEDVLRAALQLAHRYDEYFDGLFLAASRDPSVRVRILAVSTVVWLTQERASSGALDATILGALYDPHPGVQTVAVPALWRGRFASEAIRQAAQNRVIEMWPSAHRDIRIAVARETSVVASHEHNGLAVLRRLAHKDRSVLVRWASDSRDA